MWRWFAVKLNRGVGGVQWSDKHGLNICVQWGDREKVKKRCKMFDHTLFRISVLRLKSSRNYEYWRILPKQTLPIFIYYFEQGLSRTKYNMDKCTRECALITTRELNGYLVSEK